MKSINIDRFEGIYAICEDADGKLFAIETAELPEGAVEGTVLSVNDTEGTLKIDQAETDRRRSKNARLQKKAFGR